MVEVYVWMPGLRKLDFLEMNRLLIYCLTHARSTQIRLPLQSVSFTHLGPGMRETGGFSFCCSRCSNFTPVFASLHHWQMEASSEGAVIYAANFSKPSIAVCMSAPFETSILAISAWPVLAASARGV